MAVAFDFIAAALLGIVVGLAELVSRYRDAPQAALYSRPALLYLALNGAASGLALALIRGYGWTFGAAAGPARWTQLLVAGVGAMAFLRTSLFTVRAGDRDIGIGPATFLQTLRDATDREVDRQRARTRILEVGKLMDGVDYGRASESLIPYCLALMQNVPDDEQQKLVRAVKLLDPEPIDAAVKVRILGLLLMNVVGPEVLSVAVDSFREQMKK
jgi:hypothetical protein